MKQFILTLPICFIAFFLKGQIYNTNLATAKFKSEAPLEIIKAESNQLKGALDLKHKTFAFKLFVKSFDGFNSPLQKEHFYENYMEVKSFPESIFKGKILEDIDISTSNEYRAKGILSIHGLSHEIIIDVRLEPLNDSVHFASKFDIRLKDYKIDLPRIVYQKIAEIISVEVFGELTLLE